MHQRIDRCCWVAWPNPNHSHQADTTIHCSNEWTGVSGRHNSLMYPWGRKEYYVVPV